MVIADHAKVVRHDNTGGGKTVARVAPKLGFAVEAGPPLGEGVAETRQLWGGVRREGERNTHQPRPVRLGHCLFFRRRFKSAVW